MPRKDWVLRCPTSGFFWEHNGTFTSCLLDATMFGKLENAVEQAKNFIPDEIEVCVVTARGARKVRT